MKCENCIHKDICELFDCQGISEESPCSFFKDQNKFIELPCKVGDTVYVLIQRNVTTEIVKGTVKNIQHSYNAWWVEFSDLWVDKMFDDFGKTVFLTREEAEQALKEREENA